MPRVFVGQVVSERRPSLRWDDNIKMPLKEIGCEGVEWIHVARNRNHWLATVNTAVSLQAS
jgi:hypothetical protein